MYELNFKWDGCFDVYQIVGNNKETGKVVKRKKKINDISFIIGEKIVAVNVEGNGTITVIIE